MAIRKALNVLMCIHFLQHAVNFTVLSASANGVPSKAVCSRRCKSADGTVADGKSVPVYQCSCSPSCKLYGDCCYDSDYTGAEWKKTDFICLSIYKHGQYRVVAECPPDQPSYFCKAAVGHLPPVTSEVTNVTYANAICARCNRDDEALIFWNVELRCSSGSDNEDISVTESTRIIYQSNHLWKVNETDNSRELCMYHVLFDNISVINTLELRACESKEQIAECSPSWTDSSVIEKCRSYEDPIYFGNELYRNSHCAECNYLNLKYGKCLPFFVEVWLKMEVIDFDAVQFCYDRGSNSCIRQLADFSRGKSYAFSNLVQINEKACVPTNGKRCCEGEKYDFRAKMCKKVSKRH